MITIISGTNRRNSRTFQIAKQLRDILHQKTVENIELLDLVDLPLDFIHSGMYKPDDQNKGLRKIQDEYMIPASKFLFVAPEYNGSIPGILKLFIDACSVREYGQTYNGKKAGMVGLASGKAGNVRGLDHLRGSLTHMGTIVMPNILLVSQVDKLMDEDFNINDKATMKAMKAYMGTLLKF